MDLEREIQIIALEIQQGKTDFVKGTKRILSLVLSDVGQSEQSCKHPNSCAMGYYHQIGDYYCSKCQKTGL